MKQENLQKENERLKQLIITRDNQISHLKNDVLELKDLIAHLNKKRFGPSSESSQEQYPLFNDLEETVQDIEREEKIEDETKVEGHTRKRGKRKPLPEALERVEEIIDLSEEEKEGKKKIGESVSEQLVIVPPKVFVKRVVRPKYAPVDGVGDITTAPAPKVLLPKNIASASLVAYIITSKYVDHLPLYRLEAMLSRVHADLNRASMARWLIKVSEKLMPLYNLLEEKCLARDYLQMDETTVQVLNEKGKKATSKSYMWLRHAPFGDSIVLYDYAPSRAGTVPIELLDGFSGTLQVDGYDGYSAACKKYNLQRIGCWDHVRRKFFDASKSNNGKNIGKKGVALIDKLYKIERRVEKLSAQERLQIRQSESVPVLEKIKAWIDELRPKITPKSLGGKAINYAYNEWEYLTQYTENSKLNISNIWIENAVRPFAVGRRNWLFSASVDGAKASAMYFSLIETAKKNGFEPFDYLSKMLDKLPHAETVDDFEKLLPLKKSFEG